MWAPAKGSERRSPTLTYGMVRQKEPNADLWFGQTELAQRWLMVWSERMSPMSSICLYFVIVFSLFNHTCYTYRILSCICRRISAFLLFTSINHSWSSFSSLALLLPTERVEHIRTTAWALNSSKTYITLNSYILVNGYPIHCTLFRITFPLSFGVFSVYLHHSFPRTLFSYIHVSLKTPFI